jgi:hypothetical protein
MALILDAALDAAVALIRSNCTALHICSAAPASYAEATTTYTLGNKATPTINAPEDGDVSGRKVRIVAIDNGTVTDTDTATHVALVDDTNSRLLAVQELSAGVAVTNGNTFTLTAFDIEIPDPA